MAGGSHDCDVDGGGRGIPGSDGLDPIGFLGPSPRLILASPTHSLDLLKGNTPSPVGQ